MKIINTLFHCSIARPSKPWRSGVPLFSKKQSCNRAIVQWSRGFTLVELIIVIGILGIITSALLLTLDPVAQIQKGRDAKRKGDLVNVQRALEIYYQDNGYYPPNCLLGDNAYTIRSGTSEGAETCVPWGSGWSNFMAKTPKDADPKRRYVYSASGTQPQTYYLYTSLERGSKDSDVCNADNSPCTHAPTGVGTDCGSTVAITTNEVCNFGVSSPNTTP